MISEGFRLGALGQRESADIGLVHELEAPNAVLMGVGVFGRLSALRQTSTRLRTLDGKSTLIRLSIRRQPVREEYALKLVHPFTID